MRRAPHSTLEGAFPPALGPAPLPASKEGVEAPTWASLRAKILSFTRGRGKSPSGPGGGRSPSAPRPPALRSPGPRSPTSRSPRSPTSRSPLSPSPCRSPTTKSPPIKSPTSRFAPPGALSRGSFTRPALKETPAPAAEPTEGIAGRRALMRRCLKKAFSLNLEGGEGGGGGIEGAGGVVGGGGGGGRKVQLKVRGSPGEQVVELTQLDEDEDEVVAAAAAAAGTRRVRKWSYQGNSTPGSPVEATTPKRHSFSTGDAEGETEHRAGIVVKNSELAGLLGPRRHLSPPGVPPTKDKPPTPPSSAVPRARGRSQSIAACWDNQQGHGGAGGGGSGPQAPVTIRRTDCDYEAAAPRSAPLEVPREEEGEEEGEGRSVPWDASAGCSLDPGLLGSAIEHFLKTVHSDETDALLPVAAPAGLQVK